MSARTDETLRRATYKKAQGADQSPGDRGRAGRAAQALLAQCASAFEAADRADRKSIEKFGFNNPVLIDEADQIMAGHGRVAAAKQLGLSEVPVLRLSHMSELEKRAFVIADNRLAEKAGWDRELLAIELGELAVLLTGEFDVTIAGFETAEIDLLLENLGAEHDRADKIPKVRAGPTSSQTGHLWRLGRHRLICGDAR